MGKRKRIGGKNYTKNTVGEEKLERMEEEREEEEEKGRFLNDYKGLSNSKRPLDYNISHLTERLHRV